MLKAKKIRLNVSDQDAATLEIVTTSQVPDPPRGDGLVKLF
jgi:hypothetical protein